MHSDFSQTLVKQCNHRLFTVEEVHEPNQALGRILGVGADYTLKVLPWFMLNNTPTADLGHTLGYPLVLNDDNTPG